MIISKSNKDRRYILLFLLIYGIFAIIQNFFATNDMVQGQSIYNSTRTTGIISGFMDSYPGNSKAFMQVEDRDMVSNPYAIDHLQVHVWSYSDPNGIKVNLPETTPGSGIFNGTVYFSTTLSSGGNVLRVSPGDKVTAEYTDYVTNIGTPLPLHIYTYIAGQPSSNPTTTGQPSSNPTETNGQVTISNGAANTKGSCTPTDCFNPQVVSVNVGDSVTWTNYDIVAHTATSGNPSDNQIGTIFDSTLISSGKSYTSPAFLTAGTYDYFCQVHPWMTGKIIVGQGTSLPPSSQPSTSSSSGPSGIGISANQQSFPPSSPPPAIPPWVVPVVGSGAVAGAASYGIKIWKPHPKPDIKKITSHTTFSPYPRLEIDGDIE